MNTYNPHTPWITMIIVLAVIAAIVVPLMIRANRQDKEHAAFYNSMTYCERIEYDIENSVFVKQKQTALMEKFVAMQSGQCLPK
jgi:hypothetical protein